MGEKPVSPRIKIASMNGVLETNTTPAMFLDDILKVCVRNTDTKGLRFHDLRRNIVGLNAAVSIFIAIPDPRVSRAMVRRNHMSSDL